LLGTIPNPTNTLTFSSLVMKVSMHKIFELLLSEKRKEQLDRTVIYIAIASFVIHLAVIGLGTLDLLPASIDARISDNPISAIYTPFSFILIYEVYLLVFYISKSTSTYITKQYEIITLIVIRRLFKDLSNLDLDQAWFTDQYDLQFTYDIVTAFILFLLIYAFTRLNKQQREIRDLNPLDKETTDTFIKRKKLIAAILVPVVFGMAVFSLGKWSYETLLSFDQSNYGIQDVNKIFFDEFFTILILTDVILLLFTFITTNQFHRTIRNSGFIISTILIRLSFGVDGIVNNALIIVAVIFGVLLLWVNNLFEKLEVDKDI
jgi:hypothetical protein